jgi:hypothetical protein
VRSHGLGRDLHGRAVEANVVTAHERRQQARERRPGDPDAALQQPRSRQHALDREVALGGEKTRALRASRGDRLQARVDARLALALHDAAFEGEAATLAQQAVADVAAVAGGSKLAPLLTGASQRNGGRGHVLAGVLGARAVTVPGGFAKVERDGRREQTIRIRDAKHHLVTVRALDAHALGAHEIDSSRPGGTRALGTDRLEPTRHRTQCTAHGGRLPAGRLAPRKPGRKRSDGTRPPGGAAGDRHPGPGAGGERLPRLCRPFFHPDG